MSSSIVDLKELHAAYTRLSEKFKTYWTFHQFLQGVHKTFFGNSPPYQIDFQSIYDEIKAITPAMTMQPPSVIVDMIHRLDLQLDGIHRTLSDADQKISPNYVRRFFEKIRTEDEKLLLALLRFYFFSRYAAHDELDKMDFLITIVGSRRSLDDGHFMPRFPVELQKLFSGFLALARRQETNPAEVKALVGAIERLRKDVQACEKFEDLTERKTLENLRTLKHKLGPAFYTVDVLSAILEANLAAKNKFQALYELEEQRILESSRRLLEMEHELEAAPEAREDFHKFKQFREEFEKQNKEKGVRHQDVTRLAESIESLMSHLGPGDLEKAAASEEPRPPSTDVGDDTDAGAAAPAERTHDEPVTPFLSDPLTAEQASKVMSSVDLIDEGTGSGHAAYAKSLSRLRLEPWEVRATRRILREELPADESARARDILYFDGAVLRLRIDEEALKLKAAPGGTIGDLLLSSGQCLVKSQESDRRFRQALEEAVGSAPPETLNELNRSRFRLLRAFSGLWLLHNAHAR